MSLLCGLKVCFRSYRTRWCGDYFDSEPSSLVSGVLQGLPHPRRKLLGREMRGQ